jgi:hypothetical protein
MLLENNNKEKKTNELQKKENMMTYRQFTRVTHVSRTQRTVSTAKTKKNNVWEKREMVWKVLKWKFTVLNNWLLFAICRLLIFQSYIHSFEIVDFGCFLCCEDFDLTIYNRKPNTCDSDTYRK